MKLVFFSGGYPKDNEKIDQRLMSLFNKKNLKVAFIPSCSYHANEDYQEFIEHYHPLGLKKIIMLNIDAPFSNVLKEAAFRSDIIHLGGGNTYYFLKHLKKTGIFKELKSWVKRGGVLTGLSAGAIVMTKKIDTAGFPSFDCDDNEESIKNFSGMNLVDFEFFPHYKNSRRYDDELIKHSKNLDAPLYACPDGSGILINDEEISFVGKTYCFIQGKKYLLNR